MSTVWVAWTPNHERSKMVGSSTAGAWIGNIIGLALGGYLCTNGFDGGWPSIFYIFGMFNLFYSFNIKVMFLDIFLFFIKHQI